MSLQIPVEESAAFELHEEGEYYLGTLYAIEEAEDRGYGPGLKWVFHLDGETDAINDEPRETWGFSGQKITQRTKAGRWVTGILGTLPPPGQVVDLGALVGARVQVMFEHTAGLDRDGNPVTRDKIDKVRAARQVEAPAPVQPVQQAVPAPAVQPVDIIAAGQLPPEEDPF